jgi:tRNA modification GTPase
MALIDQKSICVFNKADEGQPVPEGANIGTAAALSLSVATDKNLDGLIDLLKARLAADFGRGEQPSLTRARHRDVLVNCHEALARALNAPLPELVAEDLRLALRELGRMTGHVHVEELLDTIFKDFCIGK